MLEPIHMEGLVPVTDKDKEVKEVTAVNTNINNNSVCIRTHKQIVNVHNIYFYQFGSAKTLTDAFDIINSATDDDEINIRLNNPGGYLSSGIQFLNSLNNCHNSNITIYIDAPVYSMGALFATKALIQARKVVIGKNIFFMYHDYSGGESGKGNEIIEAALHTRKWTHQLFKDLTVPFLSEEEVNEIIKGKDIYLDVSEILKRFKKVHGRKGKISRV